MSLWGVKFVTLLVPLNFPNPVPGQSTSRYLTGFFLDKSTKHFPLKVLFRVKLLNHDMGFPTKINHNYYCSFSKITLSETPQCVNMWDMMCIFCMQFSFLSIPVKIQGISCSPPRISYCFPESYCSVFLTLFMGIPRGSLGESQGVPHEHFLLAFPWTSCHLEADEQSMYISTGRYNIQ